MAHHSSKLDKDLESIFGLPKSEKLGPTGEFPDGKLTKSDEGEIRIALGQKDGKVVIHFGSPVVWVGLTPHQARDFGYLLIKRASEIEQGK